MFCVKSTELGDTDIKESEQTYYINIHFFQALNVWLRTLPWICLIQLLCLCHPLPSALNVFCLQCILPTSPLGGCLLLLWGLAHITFSLKPSLSFPRQSFSVLYDAPIPDFALFKVVAFISLYMAHPRNMSLSLHNLSIMCSPRAGIEFYSISNLLCPE